MAPTIKPVASAGQRIPYVCMPGSPFTGSTLLGVLLNEHPECASMGAATGLIWSVDLATYECSCGRLFTECEFWRYAERRTAELGHPVDVFKTDFWNTLLRASPNRYLNAALVRSLGHAGINDLRDAVVRRLPVVRRAIADAGWNTWSLATAVLERTGKRVFVDTARDHQRPKYLLDHPGLDVKVIHLVRDPRGNVASIVKHMGVSVAEAARQWTHYNLEAERVRRYFDPDAWLTLHYSELCRDPRATLDRIADFIGVERTAITPDPRDANRHIIGNPMRLKALAEIREDLSWQKMLRPEDLAVITRVAGAASRKLGVGWPDGASRSTQPAPRPPHAVA